MMIWRFQQDTGLLQHLQLPQTSVPLLLHGLHLPLRWRIALKERIPHRNMDQTVVEWRRWWRTFHRWRWVHIWMGILPPSCVVNTILIQYPSAALALGSDHLERTCKRIGWWWWEVLGSRWLSRINNGYSDNLGETYHEDPDWLQYFQRMFMY